MEDQGIPKIKNIKRKNLLVFTVLMAGSIYFQSLPITLGILMGGLLIIANFKVLCQITEDPLKKGSKGLPFMIKYSLKFIFLLGIIFLVIRLELVNPLAFVAGLSTLFLSITLEGIISFFKRA